MRQGIGLHAGVGVVVLAALLPLAARADAPAPRRCNPAGSQTVVKDAVARVYKHRADGMHEVIGCSYRSGRRTFLGYNDAFDPPDGEFVRPVALRGTFVAANDEVRDHSTGTFATVSVRDLSDGKLLHRWRHGGRPCLGHTDVTVIRVNHVGSAAWIAQIQHDCGDPTQEVYRAQGSSRRPRRLDRGTAIGARSLRLRDGRMYWNHGGSTRSAPIRH
jgi:hypothetical protein